MDKHEPPAIGAESGPPFNSKTWKKKYECKPNKGDHTFLLVKRSWVHIGPLLSRLTLEQFYQHELEQANKRNKDIRDRIASGSLPPGIYSKSDVWFRYECSACRKQEYDSTRDPNKKLRPKVDPEHMVIVYSIVQSDLDKELPLC